MGYILKKNSRVTPAFVGFLHSDKKQELASYTRQINIELIL